MLSTVRQYTPDNWSSNSNNQVEVYSHDEEYRQIEYEVRRAANGEATPKIRRLLRGQNIHSFGQFLIREQLLLKTNSSQLYRVRRYMQVSEMYLNKIIKYNLDPRRCGMGQSLTFCKNFGYLDSNKLVVVVKLLTTEPEGNYLIPPTSCDYYVEYIVEF